jgi:hypothetical protein
MKKTMLVTAALDLVLIVPAALFMTALVMRNLPLQEVANAAQRIVMWYSEKMWTLWVLLLALPFTVLITGCMTLFRDRIEMPHAAGQPLGLIRAEPVSLFVAAQTLGAAGILAIVVLHMMAN